MLAVTEVWNAHFKLIEESKMAECRNCYLNFDFQAAVSDLKEGPVISFLGAGAVLCRHFPAFAPLLG